MAIALWSLSLKILLDWGWKFTNKRLRDLFSTLFRRTVSASHSLVHDFYKGLDLHNQFNFHTFYGSMNVYH